MRRAQPVEVRDVEYDLNHFMDLREQEKEIEHQVNSLKPRILKLVDTGKQKISVQGTRGTRAGRFIITAVHRDGRTFNQEAALALVKKKRMKNVIETKEVVNEDRFAELMESGYFTREEINTVLKGTPSDYPLVKFRPR